MVWQPRLTRLRSDHLAHEVVLSGSAHPGALELLQLREWISYSYIHIYIYYIQSATLRHGRIPRIHLTCCFWKLY